MADITISASNEDTVLNLYTGITEVLLSSALDDTLGAKTEQDIKSEFLSVYAMVLTPFGTQSTGVSTGGESWRD